ncbi:hypothetical protein Lal_00027208 [Lupinus albus]|nr:hypothetical protein Lal_00027208 [Lupinus albus]
MMFQAILTAYNVPKEIEILPPEPSNTKGSGKRVKGGKRRQWNNNKREQDFVRFANNMYIMIVIIVLQNLINV